MTPAKPTKTAQPPPAPAGSVQSPSLSDTNCTGRVRLLSGCAVLVAADAPDRAIAAIAAAQHGRVSWPQLQAAGASPRHVRTLVARGHLHRLHQGVYAVGHLGPAELGAEAAALLACDGVGVLSHLTALRLWQLMPAAAPASVHVTVPANRGTRSRDGFRVHRSTTLTARQVRQIQGLPTTNPERTLVDCAALLAPRQLERALDEALARRLTSASKVALLVGRTAGHPGHGRLVRLLGRDNSTVTASVAEDRLLELVRAAALPEPQWQVELHGFSVDAYWPEARFAVEVDSFQWHSGRSKFERDRRKGRVLQDHGIQLSRITATQIQDEPLPVIAHVARQIARRSAA
ncbi:MAG TPA: type IV toxin-antitoxin system AbiEi family antitoxin domain-containing protein [Solirubrobacteraceae bacterium]|nr:type IV toxin-antitoxin system AbiEi family antitoxin domain-containing protein [Solirubrobacteraceae bacterium]